MDIQEQMNQLQNALALTRGKLAFYEKLLKNLSNRNLTYLEE